MKFVVEKQEEEFTVALSLEQGTDNVPLIGTSPKGFRAYLVSFTDGQMEVRPTHTDGGNQRFAILPDRFVY